MRAGAVALVVSCWGCWTTASPPPVEPTPSTPAPIVVARRSPLHRSPCELTIDHLVDVLRDDLAKLPDFDAKLPAMREVAIASCTDTRWSPELLHCFRETVDNTALQQCQSLIDAEQVADIMRRMTDVLSGANTP